MLEAITLAPWFTAILTSIAGFAKILWDFLGRSLRQAFTFLAVWTPVIFAWIAQHFAARAAFFVVCIDLITVVWSAFTSLIGSFIGSYVSPWSSEWWVMRWIWGPPIYLSDVWGYLVDLFGTYSACTGFRFLWSKFLWAKTFTLQK